MNKLQVCRVLGCSDKKVGGFTVTWAKRPRMEAAGCIGGLAKDYRLSKKWQRKQ